MRPSERGHLPIWTAAALFALAVLATTDAHAAPVRVRGGARIDAIARFVEQDALELRGRLTDDDDAVIADGAVSVATEEPSGWSPPGSCPRPRVAVSTGRSPRGAVVHAGPKGELCVRWSTAPERGSLRLRFAGDEYHSAADLVVDFDRLRAPRRPTTLRFEPRPQRVDVDGDAVLGAVLDVGSLSRADASPPPFTARGNLPVTLHGPQGDTLAETTTRGDGKLRLAVDGARLGDPGETRIRITFAGTDELEPSSDEQTVTLCSTVQLRLVRPAPIARVGELTVLDVALEAGHGTVDSGVVEATANGLPLMTVPVRDGQAQLALPVDRAAAPVDVVTLRYLPSAPIWLAGRNLEVRLQTDAAPQRAAWLWGAVVAGAAIWTAWSWRRSRKPGNLPRAPQRETPGIRRIGKPAHKGAWTGVVVDAHDRKPVVKAQLTVHTGRVARADHPPIVQCTTDEQGRFQFDFGDRPAGSDVFITAAAQHHSEVHTALPAPGELRVVLTTRRRALLRRLVEWARARGGPFEGSAEPTPHEVARTGAHDPQVVKWADEVERAAFGPEEVDHAREEAIRAREPVTAPTASSQPAHAPLDAGHPHVPDLAPRAVAAGPASAGPDAPRAHPMRRPQTGGEPEGRPIPDDDTGEP